jgi:lipoprotein NlpD
MKELPMDGLMSRFGSALLLGMAGLLLAGCAGKNLTSAPVEDRGTAIGKTWPVEPAPVKVLPGAENAGKPGYYTVKPGDTLIRIGLDNGQSSKDIARWSALENPNLIEVGQVLRVAPPGQVPATGVVTKPVNTPSAKAAALAPVGVGAAERPVAAPAPVASSAPAPVAAARPLALQLRVPMVKMISAGSGPPMAPCWLALTKSRTRVLI